MGLLDVGLQDREHRNQVATTIFASEGSSYLLSCCNNSLREGS